MSEVVIMGSEVSQFVADFGKIPLLPDEAAADFDALRLDVFGELNPKGVFETVLAHEIVSHLWSEKRYRRLRDHFVRSKLIDALARQLEPYLSLHIGLLKKVDAYAGYYDDFHRARRLVILWLTKDSQAFKPIDALIKSLGGIVHDAVAHIHGAHISEISAFEALIREAIRSRNQSLADFFKLRGEKKKSLTPFNALGLAGGDPPLEGVLS